MKPSKKAGLSLATKMKDWRLASVQAQPLRAL